MNQGKLFVISAPSGAGKTSLIKQLKTQMQQLVISTSHTTRAMRPGEVDGVDYFFVSLASFKYMLAQGAFIEQAQVYDNYYGTAQHKVEANLQQGLDVILEIDWQGAAQIKKICPESISIFILPPSIQILQDRLTARAQDSSETITRRMRDAIAEISHYAEFDYLVVNNDFDQALFELKSIITAQRLTQQRQEQQLQTLLTALLN